MKWLAPGAMRKAIKAAVLEMDAKTASEVMAA
jgi:hypothetical protein